MKYTTELKSYIAQNTEELYRSASLFKRSQAGTMTCESLDIYLACIGLNIKRTIQLIKYCAETHTNDHSPLFKNFFNDKHQEEVGHDAWADADLHKNGKVLSQYSVTTPDQILAQLTHESRKWIKEDTAYYAVYFLWAELFTVLIGPKWMSDLTKSGITKPEDMSVIANHAELDKDHVDDDLALLEEWYESCTNKDHVLKRSLEIIDTCFSHYRRFAQACLEYGDTHASRTSPKDLSPSL